MGVIKPPLRPRYRSAAALVAVAASLNSITRKCVLHLRAKAAGCSYSTHCETIFLFASFQRQWRHATIIPLCFWFVCLLLLRLFVEVSPHSVTECLSASFESTCRSDYDDWKPALASLLQPIPFPKEWVSTQLLENFSLFCFVCSLRHVQVEFGSALSAMTGERLETLFLCVVSHCVNTPRWDNDDNKPWDTQSGCTISLHRRCQSAVVVQ